MSETQSHKFFQLNKIAKILNIKKDKLYNNFNGKYNSLAHSDDEDKKRIIKLMIPHVKEFFGKLGMSVSFSKKEI